MPNIHPDLSIINAMPRTQDLLAILPRLDRSGMRSLNLVLPLDTASRVKKDVVGSSTQAVAIITRWVLEDLQVNGNSLVWDGGSEKQHKLLRNVSYPLIDSAGRKVGNELKNGSQSLLASLPPLTHEKLRTTCKGSLRAIVMTALEYGIMELDRRGLTLSLAEEITEVGVQGRLVVNAAELLTTTQSQRSASFCQTLSWLGFDALPFILGEIYQKNDILLNVGGSTEIELLSFPGRIINPPDPWLASTDPSCWLVGMSMDWTQSAGMAEALSGYRANYCENCGYGAKGSTFTRVFVPSRNSAIRLCGHCARMHKV